jgi:hypothetical protein
VTKINFIQIDVMSLENVWWCYQHITYVRRYQQTNWRSCTMQHAMVNVKSCSWGSKLYTPYLPTLAPGQLRMDIWHSYTWGPFKLKIWEKTLLTSEWASLTMSGSVLHAMCSSGLTKITLLLYEYSHFSLKKGTVWSNS